MFRPKERRSDYVPQETLFALTALLRILGIDRENTCQNPFLRTFHSSCERRTRLTEAVMQEY